MLAPAVLAAVVSIGLGTALALLARHNRRVLGPVQTFAFVAVSVVVFAELIPEALDALGLIALVPFALAIALPSAMEKLLRAWGRAHPARTKDSNAKGSHLAHDDHWAGIEIGYLGLLVHQIIEGIGLSVYGGGDSHGARLEVILAMSAHTIPVAALFVMTIHEHRGRRAALGRAFALLVATLFGTMMHGFIPEAGLRAVVPWVSAAFSGFLLHIVLHDWNPSERMRTRDRFFELSALLAGLLLVPLVADVGHVDGSGGGADGARASFAASFFALLHETAAPLAFGLVLAALVQVFGKHIPSRLMRSGSNSKDAMRGAILGAPLPVCSCGVLPIAQGFKTRGAGTAFVIAFLIATPELGIETFALTAKMMGVPFAIIRVVSAVAIAVFVAHVVARYGSSLGKAHSATTTPDEGMPDAGAAKSVGAAQAAPSLLRRFLTSLDELVIAIGPWIVVGLAVAAYLERSLPADAFVPYKESGLDILMLSLIAMPTYVCATSSTPLVMVLLGKGISQGAALSLLLLGPATNVATIGFLRSAFSGRFALVFLVALFSGTWALAYAFNLMPIELGLAGAEDGHVGHVGPFSYGGLIFLALLVVRSLWLHGLNSWTHTIADSLGLHKHTHGAREHDGHEGGCCS